MILSDQQQSQLKNLPSVDTLLRTDTVLNMTAVYDRDTVVTIVREYLEALREQIRSGGACPSREELVSLLEARVLHALRPSLIGVINATGVIIHTNLGRALLSKDTLAAMSAAGREYGNLEYDLQEGKRGSRYVHATILLKYLTGAEDALVVNNNAAALVLVLSALAKGHEALISRGHLVEIGGGFRIPDIMVQSGARLVEVGTTNRTYRRDYGDALSEETAAILRVHASNFLITGFTHEPTLEDIVALGHETGVPIIHDLGSGALLDTKPFGLAAEPLVQDSVAAGVDLTCFSGDKLLGGPQAGIIVGRAELVSRLKRHPLARAMRVDKTTLAGLQATLMHYLRREALSTIPVWQMISMTQEEIARRANHIARELVKQGIPATALPGHSAIGGGSLPGQTLPTTLVSLDVPHPSEFAARLRAASPPVIVRIEEDHVLLDPRTILPDQDEILLLTVVTYTVVA